MLALPLAVTVACGGDDGTGSPTTSLGTGLSTSGNDSGPGSDGNATDGAETDGGGSGETAGPGDTVGPGTGGNGPGTSSGTAGGGTTGGGVSTSGTGADSDGTGGGVRFDVGGDTGGGDPGDPVSPPWIPPDPDDNCGPRCFWAPELDEDGVPQPPDPDDLFQGTETGPKPSFVYPLVDSMHAINMLWLTPQWLRGTSDHEIVRIVVEGVETWRFYVVCETANAFPIVGQQDNNCVYQLPAGSWGALAHENRDQPVTLTVTTTNGTDEISTSDPLTISFSPDAVQGGLYYWANRLRGGTEYGHESMIMRVLLGAAEADPYIRPETAENPEECGGCHSLSRDGEVIAFSAGSRSNSGLLAVTPTQAPDQHRIAPGDSDAVLMTLNPDGSRVLSTHSDGILELRDTLTGNLLETIDPTLHFDQGATHPEWAPDGRSIVVTVAPRDAFALEDDGRYATWSVTEGSIAIMPVAGDTVGPAEMIVEQTGEEMHVFPSFSPDGEWVAFVSAAPGGPFGDNTQNPNTRLRLINLDTREIYDLDAATQRDGTFSPDPENRGDGPFSTWPKFAPFVQAGGEVMFLTFHSHIRYGFIHTDRTFENGSFVGGNPRYDSMQPVQLWLAGIDFRRLGTGDPSLPPVWLTQQDPLANNHLGFWAQEIGCEEGQCPSGTMCIDDVCVPDPVG